MKRCWLRKTYPELPFCRCLLNVCFLRVAFAFTTESQWMHHHTRLTHVCLLFPTLFLTDMYYCHIPTISYAVICIEMTSQEMNRFVDIFKVFSSSKFELFLGQHREKLLSINYNVNIGLKVKKMRHFPANFVLWFKFCPFFGCGGLEVQENFFEFQARPR